MSAETKTRVIILTGHYRITGNIDLMPGARVTDFLTESRDFLAVTEADVWDMQGRKLFASGFMDVNRERIELIMPEQSVTQGIWRGVV